MAEYVGCNSNGMGLIGFAIRISVSDPSCSQDYINVQDPLEPRCVGGSQ